jgi:hypothetical protein
VYELQDRSDRLVNADQGSKDHRWRKKDKDRKKGTYKTQETPHAHRILLTARLHTEQFANRKLGSIARLDIIRAKIDYCGGPAIVTRSDAISQNPKSLLNYIPIFHGGRRTFASFQIGHRSLLLFQTVKKKSGGAQDSMSCLDSAAWWERGSQ